MRKSHKKCFLFALLMLVVGYSLWPALHPYIGSLTYELISFRQFSYTYPVISYFIYSLVFVVILFLGLPLATAIMLLAGINYGFWEAAVIITICRMSVAIITFAAARKVMSGDTQKVKKKPKLIEKLSHHPGLALFIMRLAPFPDNAVNLAVASSPITSRNYVVLSLIGMIPITMLCVWAGGELGSVTKLISYLN